MCDSGGCGLAVSRLETIEVPSMICSAVGAAVKAVRGTGIVAGLQGLMLRVHRALRT